MVTLSSPTIGQTLARPDQAHPNSAVVHQGPHRVSLILTMMDAKHAPGEDAMLKRPIKTELTQLVAIYRERKKIFVACGPNPIRRRK